VDVYDVRSRSTKKAIDGTIYNTWWAYERK
jgi:hypothetical protein